MTTREENLKKINDELEKLSDEQLDNIAGGSEPMTMEELEKLAEKLIKWRTTR